MYKIWENLYIILFRLEDKITNTYKIKLKLIDAKISSSFFLTIVQQKPNLDYSLGYFMLTGPKIKFKPNSSSSSLKDFWYLNELSITKLSIKFTNQTSL